MKRFNYSTSHDAGLLPFSTQTPNTPEPGTSQTLKPCTHLPEPETVASCKDSAAGGSPAEAGRRSPQGGGII